MDIKASVDVGDNITKLIQQFASGIGTTADKIYPYYVKQAYFNGLASLVSFTLFITACSILALYNFKRVKDWDNEADHHNVIAVIAAVAGGIAVIIFAGDFNCIVTSIANPEYKGTHMLIEDVSRLIPK